MLRALDDLGDRSEDQLKKFSANKDVLGLILFVTIGLPIFYFVVLPIALNVVLHWVAPQPKVRPLPAEDATN